LHAELRGPLAWAAGYALVALLAGAVGAAGIADGLSLFPFVHLLALSALALAASLLFGIVSMLAGMASLARQPATTPLQSLRRDRGERHR
jgi:hypothetical protein